jgi:hypothetical protein
VVTELLYMYDTMSVSAARGYSTGLQGDDPAAYRDPHSDKAWHAAQVTQDNVKPGVTAEAAGAGFDVPVRQGGPGGGDGAGARMAGAAQEVGRGVREQAETTVGTVRGAAEVAGEEVRRAAGGAVGAVQGAAEVAGGEMDRAAGAAGGAAQVAAEEVSCGAGKLCARSAITVR